MTTEATSRGQADSGAGRGQTASEATHGQGTPEGTRHGEATPEDARRGRAAPEAMRAAAGAVIGGRYVLHAGVGAGGMGTVWQAYDQLLRREVAVKEVLLPATMSAADRDVLIERTLREARAAAGLNHPAVVRVYDVVNEGDRPWIVMELLAARSLAEIVAEDGPVSPRGVAKIGLAMLGALEAAHAAGVLHRDVKPGNVLIGTDGRCVLTDFGVARVSEESDLTAPGMVLGSPHYISPERAMGGAFGPPSDLFSLGVTLYTAVNGTPPFDRGDPIETMHAVVHEAPEPPRNAGPLTPVLFGLLEKDPYRRWDVGRTRAALQHLLDGPLASRSAPRREEADAAPRLVPPYVPAVPPAPLEGDPSGPVGGRAMLAPGESPIDRAARNQTEPAVDPLDVATGVMPAPTPGSPAGPPALDQTLAGQAAYAQGWAAPPGPGYPPMAPPGYGPPGSPVAPGYPPGPPGYPPAGGYPPPGYGAPPGAPPGSPAPGWAQPGWQAPPGAPAAAGKKGNRWLIVAGAVVGVAVLVLGIGAAAGWFSGGHAPARTQASAKPSAPAAAMKPFHDQAGFTVDVPAAWTERSSGGSYTDFIEPGDTGRRIRVNSDHARTAHSWAEGASANLARRPAVCPQYQMVGGIQDTQLAGQPAAVFEYTCDTAGGELRHGIWEGVVVNGEAYHFYLSVPASQYDQSKPIFEAMANSFKLG